MKKFICVIIAVIFVMTSGFSSVLADSVKSNSQQEIKFIYRNIITTVNDNTLGTGIEQFEYAGVWTYVPKTKAEKNDYHNDYHLTADANGVAKVRFNGTKIKFYSTKSPLLGKAYISIDNGTETLVDLYNKTLIDSVSVFESATLAADKEHSLKIRVAGVKNDASTGTAITIDRVEIAKTIPSTSQKNIIGTVADAKGIIDLSSADINDWMQWGNNNSATINRKVTAAQMISNFTKIGKSNNIFISGNPATYSWNNGTPTANAVASDTALYFSGRESGIQFTVPADTTQRTLKVYVSAWSAKGNLTATLNDGTTSPLSVDVSSESTLKCQVITIDYRAIATGKILTVKYVADSIRGNLGMVSLQAVTIK